MTARIKKGSEVRHLPLGCRIEMDRQPEGHWTGTIRHGDVAAEAAAAGLMSLMSKLARKYLAARGESLHGRVAD